MKAMKTVREWEYTSRFGHLGRAQTSWAHNARVVEYFSDAYATAKEALHKADVFLSICDYLARNATVFGRTLYMDAEQPDNLAVDPALLRAIHHVFTSSERPAIVDPMTIVALAKAYDQVEKASHATIGMR